MPMAEKISLNIPSSFFLLFQIFKIISVWPLDELSRRKIRRLIFTNYYFCIKFGSGPGKRLVSVILIDTTQVFGLWLSSNSETTFRSAKNWCNQNVTVRFHRYKRRTVYTKPVDDHFENIGLPKGLHDINTLIVSPKVKSFVCVTLRTQLYWAPITENIETTEVRAQNVTSSPSEIYFWKTSI